jgi:hypothetical protein
MSQYKDKDIEKFWSQVQKTDSCWLWQGRKMKDRTGVFYANGHTISARRFAWEITNGPIHEGLRVYHMHYEGDAEDCVNPAHLYLGTKGESLMRAFREGRATPHRRTPLLSQYDALEAQNLYSQGWTLMQLAQKYHVSGSTIRRTVHIERRMEERRKETTQRILSRLTPDQLKYLAELVDQDTTGDQSNPLYKMLMEAWNASNI